MSSFDLNLFSQNLIDYLPYMLAIIAIIQIFYAIYLALTGNVRADVGQPTEPIRPIVSGAWSQDKLSSGVQTILSQFRTGSAGIGTNLDTGTNLGDPNTVGMFVVETGLQEKLHLPLPSSQFHIGRFEGDNMMAIDDPSISRNHALFIGDEDNQEYYLTDTESTYGTYLFIDGIFQQLAPYQQVQVFNQDVIRLGMKIQIRINLPTDLTRKQANK